MLKKDIKILIIGLGLIGASYAKRLHDKGYYVGGIARREDTIKYALENGFIDSGMVEVKEEYVKDFDLVVFGLYPKVLKLWIANYGTYFKKGAVITDVTGVKCAVVYDIEKMIKEDAYFVASHPMVLKMLIQRFLMMLTLSLHQQVNQTKML